MPSENVRTTTGAQVPYPDRTVRRPTDQRILRSRQCPNSTFMTIERTQELTSLWRVDVDGMVI